MPRRRLRRNLELQSGLKVQTRTVLLGQVFKNITTRKSGCQLGKSVAHYFNIRSVFDIDPI